MWDYFGNHRLFKFPEIKQKEQLTKERRKSPTDKRAISSPNYPLRRVRKNNLMALGTFKLGIEDTSISPQTLGPSLRANLPVRFKGSPILSSLESSVGCLCRLLRVLSMDLLILQRRKGKGNGEREKKGKGRRKESKRFKPFH